jgi:thiamine pyrophosphokinase
MTHIPKALIILNGAVPTKALLQELITSSDITICADGAAQAMVEYGLAPDIILGDLDSITEETRISLKNSEIIKIDDQESTDGEKAFQYCLEKGISEVLLAGGFGKRLDHSLYNLGLLKKFHEQGLTITCYSDHEKAMLIQGSVELNEKPGTSVSVIPIFGDAIGVKMEGFKFKLKKDNLQFGDYSSISNVIQLSKAKIALSIGYLLLIVNSDLNVH